MNKEAASGTAKGEEGGGLVTEIDAILHPIRRLLPLVLGLMAAACAMEFPLTRGEELAQQGRWEEAVQFFQEAAKQNPQNLEARVGLARAPCPSR